MKRALLSLLIAQGLLISACGRTPLGEELYDVTPGLDAQADINLWPDLNLGDGAETDALPSPDGADDAPDIPPPPCSTDEMCHDGVDCTVDSCDLETGSCRHLPDHRLCPSGSLCQAEGCLPAAPCLDEASCQDGFWCNGLETCSDGLCAPSLPPVCDDEVDCTDDECHEASDECLHHPNDEACEDGLICLSEVGCLAPLPCGTAEECDDGLYCTGEELCIRGLCVPGTARDCNDGVSCTADSCVESVGACQNVPLDNLCSSGLHCDPLLGCQPLRPCTGDGECDDANFCNGQESCIQGVCQAGPPVECVDGLDCTEDLCDDQLGACQFVPHDSWCFDDLFCNGDEVCDPTLGCIDGQPHDCEDGDPCTWNQCSEALRQCLATEVDQDEDGFSPRECGGLDCDDHNPLVNPLAGEDCHDGVDNNCNGHIDDDDPLCMPSNDACDDAREIPPDGGVYHGTTEGLTDDYESGCGGTGPDAVFVLHLDTLSRVSVNTQGSAFDTVLYVGREPCGVPPYMACNDDGGNQTSRLTLPEVEPGALYIYLDGWNDDAWGEYTLEVVIEPTGGEICDDAIDNDGDNLIDCNDPDCFGPRCPEVCNDGEDNDGDGLTDCADADCLGPACPEVCDDRRDNDGDGLIDCADHDCFGPACPEICDDHLDNDGDGLIDCSDPFCFGPTCPEICDDHLDNDGDGLIDCNDPFCFGPACPEVCNDHLDNDGDGLIDCADPFCFGPACPEICDDHLDNDRDGLTDCADPHCFGPACREVCDDGQDNDGDRLIDCADPDCFGPFCPEDCDDGRDNDGDGLIDCADPFCFGPACPEICNDYRDNDGDGLTDCPDPDCAGTAFCIEVCDDNRDNDADGLTDCADPDCAGTPACTEICNDGRDNDRDLLIDCYDPDCEHSSFCIEICDDGRDNDRDGLTDCNDPDCLGWPTCPEMCNDGLDNDGDSWTDCFDPDCWGSSLCPEICNDGWDNDGDHLIDCDDPDCTGCPEVCHDAMDNDGDGLIDCHDPDCPACPEDCTDAIDNDGDGLIDCHDPDCAGPACPEDCDDAIDNDGDGYVDCADPDCQGTPLCPEVCDDGEDNDGDGRMDCADPDCFGPSCPEVCQDGLDNDGDGITDCCDPDCMAICGCDAEICDDGIDNEGDGLIDCQDPDCLGSAPCTPGHSCDNPMELHPPQTVHLDTTALGNDTQGSCGGGDGADAVFVLTLTEAATLTLDTYGSDYDTALYVRSTRCTSGMELACNDNSGGLQSRLVLQSLHAGTYYILADAVWPTLGGHLQLNVDISGPDPENCRDGVDNNGDGLIDCQDVACEAQACGDHGQLCRMGTCLCPGNREICGNGLDDNCNDLVDCLDPACLGDPTCPTETNCDDGLDNDHDGPVDCMDRDCEGRSCGPYGQFCLTGLCICPGGPEGCANGLDDDCDGLIDCADPDCLNQPPCEGEHVCDDGQDNDGDGRPDCDDPDCDGLICGPFGLRCQGHQCRCPQGGVEICNNRMDDDCDGLSDCADPDCLATPHCTENCSDNIDNDGDGLVDCQDRTCEGQACAPNGQTCLMGICQCVEDREFCANGRDDDCDGLIDCADPDCVNLPECDGEHVCDDGQDNDRDGLIDCLDPDCTGLACGPHGLACRGWLCLCSVGDMEICGNGLDDNCNGLIDCDDHACACPDPEVCDDSIDNDGDGLTDCADPSCATHQACAGDRCDTAIDVSAGGTFTGSTQGLLPDYSGTCGGRGPDRVFVLRLDSQSDVDIQVTGLSFNPVLYMRSGDCQSGGELACVVADNDASVAEARLEKVNAGAYYIFLDGVSAGGDYVLQVSTRPSTAGTCASPLNITGGGTFVGTVAGWSNMQGSCGGDGPESVFFFHLDMVSDVTIDPRGTAFDTMLSIRAGDCQDPATELACIRSNATGHVRLELPRLAPGDYYLILDSATATTGSYTVAVIIAPSRNDHCEEALLIPLDGPSSEILHLTGTTSGYANDVNASTCSSTGAPDAVYRIDLQEFATLEANTVGSAYDTALHLREDTCTGRELACNDDTFGLMSAIRAANLAPGTYYLWVDGYSSGSYGNYTLNLALREAINDTCSQAFVIEAGTYHGSTSSLTNGGVGSCGGNGPDGVFSLTLTERARVTVTTAGSAFDSVLYLRRGSCDGPEVGCNDDDGTLRTSRLDLTLEPDRYYLYLDGFNPDSAGEYTLGVSFEGP